MLMLDPLPQAETPGVTHFRAYHRPPDGHFLKTKVHWQFCKVQHLWGTGEVSGSPRWSRVLHRSWPSASWSPTRRSRPSAPPLRTYTIIIRDIVRTIRGGGFLLL